LLAQLQTDDEEDLLKKFLAFPVLVLSNGISKIKSRAQLFASGDFSRLLDDWPHPRPYHQHDQIESDDSENAIAASTLRQAIRLAKEGAISKAVQALQRQPTMDGPEVEHMLRQLHPTGSPVSLVPVSDEPDTPFTTEEILTNLRSFAKRSAAGPSGWSPDHFIELSRVSKDFTSVLARLCTILAMRSLSADIKPWVFGARLIALRKKDMGIRPIGCGEAIRRLAAKCLCARVKHEISSYCSKARQVGFGIPGGVDLLFHTLKAYTTSSADVVIATVDLSNAFNTVDRQAIYDTISQHCPELQRYFENAYSQPSNLLWRDVIIPSAQGVQQGDPLGPPLFALAVARALTATTSTLPFEGWYLDDGTLCGPLESVLQRFKDIGQHLQTIGLNINLSKCQLFTRTGSLPPHLQSQASSVGFHQVLRFEECTILGLPLFADSPSMLELSKQSKKLIQSVTEIIVADPHIGITMLRLCTGVPEVNHLLRAHGFAPPLFSIEEYTLEALRTLFPDLDASHRAQMALPIRLGGLGLRLLPNVARNAHIASLAAALRGLNSLFGSFQPNSFIERRIMDFINQYPSRMKEVEEVERSLLNDPTFSASHLQRRLQSLEDANFAASLLSNDFDAKRILAASARDAGNFLSGPFYYHKWLDRDAFRINFALRFGIPFVPQGLLCRACRHPLDAHGHHIFTCMASGDKHIIHNAIRDTLSAYASQALLNPTKEVMCFPGSQDRIDLLLKHDHSGRETLVDVAITYPLRSGALVGPDAAANAYEEIKWSRYRSQLCPSTQAFVPFVMDTLGGASTAARSLLKFVHNAAKARALYHGSININVMIRHVLCRKIAEVFRRATEEGLRAVTSTRADISAETATMC